MMETILLVYYIIALALGIFCLGCYFIIHRYNKNEIIKTFIICYGLFCLFILATTIRTFLYLPEISHSDGLHFIIYAVQFLGIFFSLMILTILINKIHLVPYTKKANKILFLFTIVSWFYCIFNYDGVNIISSSFLNLIDDELFYIVIIIYNAFIYYRYRKNIKNLKLYGVLRIAFFIILLSVPGFIIDEFLSSGGNHFLLFTPLFFILISIFSLYSFLKYHEAMQSEPYEFTEELRNKIGISERELDVIKLLLKGYSYQKIADELIISISTVRTHVTSIYKKAGINSRYELYNIINKAD